MTVTISRLYDNYCDARRAVRDLKGAGVKHCDISIIASNADSWYDKDDTYPDRDLDGKDDRAEAAGAGAGIGAAAGGTVGALTGLDLMAIPGRGTSGGCWMAGGRPYRRCGHRRSAWRP